VKPSQALARAPLKPDAAVRVVAVFAALVTLSSACLYALRLLIPFGAAWGPLRWSEPTFDFLRMASVGASGLLASFWITGSLAGIGFRRARWRYFLASAILPLAYGAAIYGSAWASGIARFGGASALVHGAGAAIARTPSHFIAASGEEIGWRGALTPALAVRFGPRAAGVVTGFAWAVWHYVDIVFFGFRSGAPLLFELICFTCALVGLSVFLAWLRLASASVWPGAVLHAAHNISMYAIYERANQPTAASVLVTGEFGLGFAIAGLALGAFGWLRLPPARALTAR